MDLFEYMRENNKNTESPLAMRLRPETLDEMVENAFNDQCTGANPRYPLMSEIKEMYLKAYYGADYKPAE